MVPPASRLPEIFARKEALAFSVSVMGALGSNDAAAVLDIVESSTSAMSDVMACDDDEDGWSSYESESSSNLMRSSLGCKSRLPKNVWRRFRRP